MKTIEALLTELIDAQNGVVHFSERGPSRGLKAAQAECNAIRAEIVEEFEELQNAIEKRGQQITRLTLQYSNAGLQLLKDNDRKLEQLRKERDLVRATSAELRKMADAAVEVAVIFNRDLRQRENEVTRWKAWASYWQRRHRTLMEFAHRWLRRKDK